MRHYILGRQSLYSCTSAGIIAKLIIKRVIQINQRPIVFAQIAETSSVQQTFPHHRTCKKRESNFDSIALVKRSLSSKWYAKAHRHMQSSNVKLDWNRRIKWKSIHFLTSYSWIILEIHNSRHSLTKIQAIIETKKTKTSVGFFRERTSSVTGNWTSKLVSLCNRPRN